MCNAIVLPHVSQFNLIACPERYADIARALGEKVENLSTMQSAQRAIDKIKELGLSVGIPKNLSVLGVKESDLETMAKNAKNDACQLTNPRKASLQEVVQLFKNAL